MKNFPRSFLAAVPVSLLLASAFAPADDANPFSEIAPKPQPSANFALPDSLPLEEELNNPTDEQKFVEGEKTAEDKKSEEQQKQAAKKQAEKMKQQAKAPAAPVEEPSLEGAPLPETAAEAPSEPAPMVVEGAEPAPDEVPTYTPREERAVTIAKADRGKPVYDRERPNWGFQATFSPQALGKPLTVESTDTNGNVTGEDFDVIGISLEFDYLPSFLQAVGVFGLGITANLYPVSPEGLTDNFASLISAGFNLQYQARFFDGQWLVPTVGFEGQLVHYNLTDIGSGKTFLTGTSFGAMLLLNGLEPSSARQSYLENGIKRSYLTAQFRHLTSSDNLVDTIGNALYIGFRLEY